jgi:hypothetical protein
MKYITNDLRQINECIIHLPELKKYKEEIEKLLVIS